jgi:hypothetical protein
MEWFYGNESSAGYVATFMPTTFEYYRDTPNELGLRAEVEVEINRGVLVLCILNAVCSGDDIEKANLKNLIKEGLSPEKVRLIELAFNEAESMNMKFMLGKSGFNRLNMLEQHKNDFENLVDTVAMLEEEDLMGDENGAGRLIASRRKKFEEEYGIVS